MTETRIKVSSIVENQLPQFIIEEFPLISEFLSQYYISLESDGGPSDILQNIDKYIKLDNLTNLVEFTNLTQDVDLVDNVINVISTEGFPNSYGILLIDSEIISYTSKTSTTFEGCIRGFSGVTSLTNLYDELTFSKTESKDHAAFTNESNTPVLNLSVLFLKEFLLKIKKQLTPGFESRELYPGLNENIFIKHAIDFYSSKGTDNSFKILFSALYGEPVEVIKPRDYIIQPSSSQYRITSDLIVESIQGDPEKLVNKTLRQDKSDHTNAAQGTITKVEKITRDSKDYYIISLDRDYDKDIEPVGTIYGKFNIHPKTRLISNIVSGSNTLYVDSTVSFPKENGNLVINLDNETTLNVKYKSKTLNQFLECSGISQDIPELTEIKLDLFAYGFDGLNEIRVRILGVLSDVEIPDNTKLYSKGDSIKIKTLGINSKDYKLNNWFFNIPTKYTVKEIIRTEESDNSYRIDTYDNHSFRLGDPVTLVSLSGEEQLGTVFQYNNEKSIGVRFGIEIDIFSALIKKNISKPSFLNYPSVNQYTSNIQNVYYENDNNFYVASSSLPSYYDNSGKLIDLTIDDRSIIAQGPFSDNENVGTIFNCINPHNLYTGDAVVYKPTIENNIGIPTGIYYVKKIDGDDYKIKLSRSKDNIFTENFISINSQISSAKFELLEFTFRNLETQVLESQKLIRKISIPENDGLTHETEPGMTGIFVNGVELINYKSKHNVYYGPIEEVFPTSLGEGYDVINPPVLEIDDAVGSGAISHCSVIGSLERFDIIDPGFDYLEEPIINIEGGNGIGALAKTKLISFDHSVSFNSKSSGVVKLDPINEIVFAEYHKFRDNEEIIYISNDQPSIGGISTNSVYFASIKDDYTIRLHKSLSDSVSGINTIKLTSYGTGIQLFKSKNKKKKIGSIFVESSGVGYQNKLTISNPAGINTSSNTINIKNHGYENGELVVYHSTQTAVGGLSSSTKYYVTKIDQNQFLLSQIGISSLGITSSFYYDTKQYVNLTSTGSGLHKFNYPEIKATVIGKIGVSTNTNQNYNAVVRPIFRGKIQSVFLESGGSSYGSEDIIDYNRQPSFNLKSGSGIELKPIVLEGQIVKVLINSPGSGYNSSPDLKVVGSGVGAVLCPIFSNGTLIDVKVIYGGIGYNQDDTFIEVISAGNGAKFEFKIKPWKINLVQRLLGNKKILDNNNLNGDDGILTSGLNSEYGLQYAHAYAPRLLRSLVQATIFRDGKKQYVKDLQKQGPNEIDSNAHSPIIGWSYDGNPIYGPYGYSLSDGSIKLLKSGYAKRSLSNISNRPTSSLYPLGFFIDDYEFLGTGDLDEHNGRFCITPEYPNGIYAYFTTLENSTPYKTPIFPYVIGPTYKSKPISFNFKSNSNQDYININETKWKRNTTPYNIINGSYDYILNPNKIKPQNIVIQNISYGSLDDVGIVTGGKEYKVNDRILFNERNIKSKVSLIKGKPVSQISVASSSIDDVEFLYLNKNLLGFTTVPHNFTSNDLISFTGQYDYKKSGTISVFNNTLSLTSGVGSAGYTGIITYFYVSGNTEFPFIKENDIYQIGNEQVKILNVYNTLSKIKVLRNQNGTVGLITYSPGSKLTENSKKFTINFGISTSYNSKINKEFYFNPEESIGIGTEVTSTLFLSLNNFNNQVSIGTGSTTFLYFSNPKDIENYLNGGYVNLLNSTNSSFDTNKRKIVSIGKTSIGINFDTSSLSGIGVTSYVDKWNVKNIPSKTIYLPNHKLETNDTLIYKLNGGSSIGVSTNGVNSFTLSNNSNVYSIKISDDLIGISTIKVGLNSIGSFIGLGSVSTNVLYFTSFGSGTNHSFKTNYDNILTGQISKNVVTVSTAETHGLSLYDGVNITINSGVSTTYVIKYNDYNRRLVVNPRSFSSIDTNSSIIRINNHGFYNGQKVIYTSNNPATGLVNEGLYYIVTISPNKIKLSNSYYQATKEYPETINISSSTPGIISPINPPINIIKNQVIIFDVSDSSLAFENGLTYESAFDLKFYEDENFKSEFTSTKSSEIFEVKKIGGDIGKDSSAKIVVSTNKNFPSNLFYKLVPINLSFNSTIKKEIIIDNDVIGNNKISFINSVYEGKYSVSGVSSSSFEYNILDTPESLSYTNNIEYSTNSRSASGPIDEVLISNKGKYLNLPIVSSIISQKGLGSILEPITNNVGKVLTAQIEDIGFDYSSDFSLRPTAKLPDILKLQPLSSLDYIDVLSVGKNYIDSPSLVVIDGLTNKPINDIELKYSSNDSKVTIIKNIQTINNVAPKIIPVNNSNGIKIKTIEYNNSTKNVTVTLNASFSNIEDYPFEVGKKVLIEGTSVGIGSTGKGFNSKNYDYALFTINNIDPNIGGSISTISYNMSPYLKNGEIPGTFVDTQSFGKVIPESYFPVFNPVLKKNNFYENETVFSNSIVGIVESWDLDNQIMKVSSTENFEPNEIILGKSSGSVGIIKDVTKFDVDCKVDSSSERRKGWSTEIGFLNNDFQRIHDSDYYQYFSYSLKSKKDFSSWEDSVNSLNHAIGFKKFANLIIESDTFGVGISSTNQNEGNFSSLVDFSNSIDINCVYDFDLAKENNLIIDENLSSNEITFNSRIIQDYIESIGNRVLIIDDISDQFNSNPRPTKFSVADSFLLEDIRSKKYIISIQNKDFLTNNQQQLNLVSFVHNDSVGFINQYGTYSESSLGFFDFVISGFNGNLLYYPVDPDYGDYYLKVFSFSLNDAISGISSTSLGNSALVSTGITTIPNSSNSAVTFVNVPSIYRSGKILVQIGSTSSYYEYDEITYTHDGSNVYFLDYGKITTNNFTSKSSIGIGTYNAYISGGRVKIDLIPNNTTTTSYRIDTFNILLSDSSVSGIGTQIIGGSLVESFSTTISASGSPTPSVISSYSNLNLQYNSSYSIISIEDKTNSRYQASEFLTITNLNKCEYVEYGVVETNSSIGILTSGIYNSKTNIYFTPLPNIEVDVKVFQVSIGLQNINEEVYLDNGIIGYKYDIYNNRFSDVKKSFNLTHKNLPIFYRNFNGSDSNIIDVENNKIIIPNHFYTNGEEIIYSHYNVGQSISHPIGIATTSIIGIGITNKLPSKLYVVKVDDRSIRVAASTSEALSSIPNVLNISSVGVGSGHSFISINQNKKLLLSIDNVIQSPLVSTSSTTILSQKVEFFDTKVYVSNPNQFLSGDFIKIDDEVMKITSVGVGSTNVFSVLRPWFGTGVSTHSSSALVKKVIGDYNVLENVIHFAEAPYGKVPAENLNNPDEIDYVGISTGSSFSGRVFLRSGIKDTSQEPYASNYLFDSISDEFDGIKNEFSLKSDGSNVSGISTDNSILLLNEVFQGPDSLGDYNLIENAGITSVSFIGVSTTSPKYDINISGIPRGGIIVSVGSSQGFGYHPLVSAGGTAIVSLAGTIQSISIGNSGSGYRSGIQTTVNVGVITSSTESANVEYIGIASVLNGHIVNVSITNPGSGYTSTNPPLVIFDEPLSYSNVPLIYSSSSNLGIGTGASVDIIVGQGSSVISFELKNFGYGYKLKEILTIPTGGSTGIPTNSSINFSEFQLTIDQIYNDKFSAWTIGSLQVIDSLDNLFDGFKKSFPIKINGNRVTIRSKKGSLIDIQATLLIFINDILQVPGEGYVFKGGSTITFNEPPKPGDTSKLIFYRGTGEVDTLFVDVLETIKIGDSVTLNSDNIIFQENKRTITDIISSDLSETDLYQGPGISVDENLLRPLVWCKQKDDLVINGKKITKDRIIYEPYIQPSTNIIQNIGINTTMIFVESVKSFFDSEKEYDHDGTTEKPQNKVIIISQDSLVSASGTAIVSTSGTITSINVTNGGVGYRTIPKISISNPIGIGTSGIAKSLATISNGSVTLVAITTGGYGYDVNHPPSVLFDPPNPLYEIIDNVSYSGDFGIITGINTTSVGVASTGIVFDFYIPKDSILQNLSIVNPVKTVSGIQTGYYFTLRKTNIGNGIISLNSLGNIIGIGSTFIDNIYQVAAVSIAQTAVSGIGLTTVAKVTVSVSSYNGLSGIGYSNFYGEYSWGLISAPFRTNKKEFTSNDIAGISTSPIVQRFNRLRYVGYST